MGVLAESECFTRPLHSPGDFLLLDVWFADVGIVVVSWILSEVSKFDALVVRPNEVEAMKFTVRVKHANVIFPIPLILQAFSVGGIFNFEAPKLDERIGDPVISKLRFSPLMCRQDLRSTQRIGCT